MMPQSAIKRQWGIEPMKKLPIFICILLMILVSSCYTDQKDDNQRMQTIDEDNIFNDKPLKIVINGQYQNFGLDIFSVKNKLFNILDEIGKECEAKFGYTLEFISFPENNASNETMLSLQSGLEYDLIFPTKVYTHSEFRATNKPYYYWNDDFIDLYMDLSPYLNTYAPEIYIHMQKYGYVMDMVTKDKKIYALYAGAPEVSQTGLLVKNEVLHNYNVQTINNFDELFELMEEMEGRSEIENDNKVVISNRTLLDYSMIKAGYYPAIDVSRHNVVCQLNDNYFKPLLIEETNILDVYFNEFSRFFDRSYFQPVADKFMSLYAKDGVNFYLFDRIFFMQYRIIYNDDYSGENPLNTYSFFLFDSDTPIINTVDSIQLIPVPYTCTQPEKAVSFVDWLFTDEHMAELLAFGTDEGSYPSYILSSEGNRMYHSAPTWYLFYNLIANFPDHSQEYRALTEKAIYPTLYRYLESSHNEGYDQFQKLSSLYMALPDLNKRADYIDNTLSMMFEDPLLITPDAMKKTLDEMTDKEEVLKYYNDFVKKLVK